MIHQIRIYSGLILLLFVTLHLSNLSLGLISIETMNAARVVTIEPWRTLPGTVILGGALLVHAALAFWSLFRRHNLRLKAWEATQMILGFLMPLIMFSHVFAARGMLELKDVKFDYALEFLALFVFLPEFTFLQALGLLVVWTDSWMHRISYLAAPQILVRHVPDLFLCLFLAAPRRRAIRLLFHGASDHGIGERTGMGEKRRGERPI